MSERESEITYSLSCPLCSLLYMSADGFATCPRCASNLKPFENEDKPYEGTYLREDIYFDHD